MARYHSTAEIRRYDLMKAGVLLLLLLLLALTWLATRDGDLTETAAEPQPTAEGDAGGGAIMPVPTLALPALDVPAGPVAPGLVTLSGSAGPGAQVAVSANGLPLGMTSAGVDGRWSLSADLAAGDYTIVAQTLDNVGAVVAESPPMTLTVGETAVLATPIPGAPIFDPVLGVWQMGGTTAPGQTVSVLAGGAVVGTATADDAGNWQLDLPADSLDGPVVIQMTDAAGATTETPVSVGPRPPNIDPPSDTAVAPSGTSAVAVPAGSYMWSGQGAPGTQVEVIANGASAGVATVDDAGNWSLTTDLPAGEYTVQFNSRDAAGALLVEGPAVAIVALDDMAAATPVAPVGDSLTGLLAGRADLSILREALNTAGLAATLGEPGQFTLFAPNNDAFLALPDSVVTALQADPDALAAILRYHAARGRYTATELRIVQPSTLDGRLLTITPQDNGLSVNGATVIAPDLAAANGLIHVIDRLLLPPLAQGVRPPVTDESGVSTFDGPALTVVGTAEPGRTILVELNGEPFGAPATVDAAGNWAVAGDVGPGDYRIVATMLDGATLEAIARPVMLTVR